MRFLELEVTGAYLIELEPIRDERGFFARTFAEEELTARGLGTHFPHGNLSHNLRRGTLRGMHYAVAPAHETKLVRCVRGAVQDIIVDVRPDSPSRGRWASVELSADGGQAVYIPAGVAHGFLTLADGTDVLYQMGDVFRPEAARGFRWDDPAFALPWAEQPSIVSAKDQAYPDFSR